MKSLFVIPLLMLVPAPAHAAWMTGNELLQACNTGGNFAAGQCLGYIEGVVDAIDTVGIIIDNRVFCTPERMTAGQMQDVVIKYMREHPEQRHYSGTSIVAEALSTSFPCEKSK